VAAGKMKRVLFVDDEPNVLAGLRRMMRPLRREWEMRFVESGEAALAALAEQPADVLVTDMRMPGMPGVELLEQVRSRYPQTVRLALSGHSEMDMLLRSTRVAHQFLAKPCDADEIKAAVERSVALRGLLADEGLARLAARLESLPPLPELYARLCDELASDDASIDRVGALIERDLAMTAKILQVVNSAFFGLRRQVSSPAEAAALLGLEIIEGMVLGGGVFASFETRVEGFSQGALWHHSLAVGAVARAIARHERAPATVVGCAYQAALLHDVGKLVLAANLPADYARACALVREGGRGAQEAEIEVFGHGHAEVGAYLLGLWGLPDAVVSAVAYHHRPEDGEALEAAALVRAANRIVHELDGWRPEGGEESSGALPEERLERWRDCARETLAGLGEAA